jgi:hypothetical protein
MAGVEASDQRLCVHPGDRHSGNDPARQLGSMAITPTGVPGIRIGLTAPGSAPGQRGGYPRVHLGKAIIIRGRTDPPQLDTTVHLIVRCYQARDPTIRTARIGTTLTDRHGDFHATWTAPAARTYDITARLPHPPAPFKPDTGCDLIITAN